MSLPEVSLPEMKFVSDAIATYNASMESAGLSHLMLTIPSQLSENQLADILFTSLEHCEEMLTQTVKQPKIKSKDLEFLENIQILNVSMSLLNNETKSTRVHVCRLLLRLCTSARIVLDKPKPKKEENFDVLSVLSNPTVFANMASTMMQNPEFQALTSMLANKASSSSTNPMEMMQTLAQDPNILDMVKRTSHLLKGFTDSTKTSPS